MNGNVELLNYVYQNSEMGVSTINQLIDIVEDETFREQLQHEYDEYKLIHEESRKLINKNGNEAKDISTMSKISAYLMINMKTLTDKTPSHISQMLIQGSTMGVIDAIKKIREYNDSEKDILKLMQKLLDFEERNIKELKKYL